MKSRRRWPWAILAVVLLLVGGPIAWRLRPLNAAERTLIGFWVVEGGSRSMHLTADRCIRIAGKDVGAWSASEKAISVRYAVAFKDLAGAPWLDRIYTYFKMREPQQTSDIRWKGPDRFRLGNEEFVRAP